MVGPIEAIKWSVTSRGRSTTMKVQINTSDGDGVEVHEVTVPATIAGRAAARDVLTAWMKMATADAWPFEEEDSIPW